MPSNEALFTAANALTLTGWAALLAFPRRRLVTWWICGLGVPGLLSALYVALLAIHAPEAEGGFSSLAAVAALFAMPGVLLAGWVHYLAFDLFLGAWMARHAAAEGLPLWALLPALPVTFLAGPAGLLLFLALRELAVPRRRPQHPAPGAPRMSTTTLSVPATPPVVVARTVSRLIGELDRRQPILARAGWTSLALLLLCLTAMAFDGRTLNGIPVWVKPAKFAASFVVWYWTLAWAFGLLEARARDGLVARLVVWGSLGLGWFEMGWITLRAAQSLRSHFAAEPFAALMYMLMGVGALGLVALAAVLGVLVLRRGDAAWPALSRAAMGWGLVLAGLLGGAAGVAISIHGGPYVGGTASDSGNLAPFFWSRDGGDLRVVHFLGIHAMQTLPLLGAVLLRAPRVLAPGLWLALGAVGWVALTGWAFLLAQAGHPVFG
jgi:hypothetical protein